MKKLIICEKPSLARSVLSAIPERSVRRNGYYETNNYLVSYAFGHLFGLADLESYFPGMESGRWTLDNLPFFPERMRSELQKKRSRRASPERTVRFLKRASTRIRTAAIRMRSGRAPAADPRSWREK